MSNEHRDWQADEIQELKEALDQTIHAHKTSDEWRSHWQTKAAELEAELKSAVDRVYDMWLQDDGQAWDEAETFLRQHGRIPKVEI